ncbi:MAG TPA: hypothetical protein VJS43_09195, partial [Candidatus Acidoferrales bacterium]|nr:hypothetical protein [Candidatus Acidoferrales bacterium]
MLVVSPNWAPQNSLNFCNDFQLENVSLGSMMAPALASGAELASSGFGSETFGGIANAKTCFGIGFNRHMSYVRSNGLAYRRRRF